MSTPNSDGPDISRWNPVSNWDEIPQYRLFITKATGTSQIEIRNHVDPTFDQNWEQMRRRNFEFRGCYHWLRPDISIKVQVDILLSTINSHGGLQLGEFVMLDWERTNGLPFPSVTQVEEWLTLAGKHWPGRIALYCADWVPGFTEWRYRNPDFPLVYANYNLIDPARNGWLKTSQYRADIWQWTSSHAIPGIADPTCDMNHVLNWATLKTITSNKELPMARTYRWSYSGTRLTETQLLNQWSWKNLHPEMRRRSIACANAAQDAGTDLGFGEGARDPAQQLSEFFRRHTLVSSGGCCTWGGKKYALRPGMSPISPSGFSNHDDNIFEGYALAVDFIGWENHWFDANCERFGIKNFGGAIGPGVNNEEWHGQPIELPNSREDVSAYFANGGTLRNWFSDSNKPPPPPPPPPSLPTQKKEIDMLIIDLNPNTTYWVSMLLAGSTLMHIANGHHVNVLVRGGVPRVTLGSPGAPGEVELDGILRSVKTTNKSPFGAGNPPFNQNLDTLWNLATYK